MKTIFKIAKTVEYLCGNLDKPTPKRIFCGVCRKSKVIEDKDVAKFLNITHQSVSYQVTKHFKKLSEKEYAEKTAMVEQSLSIDDSILESLHAERIPFAVLQYFISSINTSNKEYVIIAKMESKKQAAFHNFKVQDFKRNLYERKMNDAEIAKFKSEIENYRLVKKNQHGKVWETNFISLREVAKF